MEKRIVPAAEQSVLALNGPIYTTNTKIKQKILEEEEYLTVCFISEKMFTLLRFLYNSPTIALVSVNL